MTTTEKTTEKSATRPTVFTFDGAPVLSEGNIQTLLGKAPALWAHLKVYATGGENGLHMHPNEDHLFFVIAGEATFHDPFGGKTVVGPYGGIVIPRNNVYSFQSTGSGNLILLRVGTCTDTKMLDTGIDETYPELGVPKIVFERLNPEGEPFDGGTNPANKTGAVRGVPIPGKTFTPPDLR